MYGVTGWISEHRVSVVDVWVFMKAEQDREGGGVSAKSTGCGI